MVLQHGSVLVDRLAFDETDVLHYPSVPARLREQERLRATTVTLRDLGVTQSGAEVAAALVEGFTAVLDIGLRVAGPVQASVA